MKAKAEYRALVNDRTGSLQDVLEDYKTEKQARDAAADWLSNADVGAYATIEKIETVAFMTTEKKIKTERYAGR